MTGARVVVEGIARESFPTSDTLLGVQGEALNRAGYKGAKWPSDEDDGSTDDDDPDD